MVETNQNTGAPGAASPSAIVQVAALKMDSANPNLDRRALLRTKLDAITAGIDAQRLDLVLVPEYTFYHGYEHDGVKIQADGANTFNVISTGTPKSNEIVGAVDETKDWAARNQVNVVLGTVADIVTVNDDPSLPEDIVFNTQLIIDRSGQIIGYNRKVTEWTSNWSWFPNPSVKQKALESVRAYSLSTRDGKNITIFPIICDERADFDLLEKAKDFNADLLINTESDQSSSYWEPMVQSIQNGTWKPYAPKEWSTVIRDVYLDNYVLTRNVVKPAGWLVSAESFNPTGGMIELNVPPTPLESLSITDDYVFGMIGLRERSEFSNQPPSLLAGATADPSTIQPSSSTQLYAVTMDTDGPLTSYFAWSKVNGPGPVTFNFNNLEIPFTWASFSTPGSYILRADISDGLATVPTEVGVIVTDGSNTNTAPAVSAGESVTTSVLSSATLKGFVIDDGLPTPGRALTVRWNHSYPPGTLTLSNPNGLVTDVTASRPDTFYISLTASDGVLSSVNYVAVTFEPGPR